MCICVCGPSLLRAQRLRREPRDSLDKDGTIISISTVQLTAAVTVIAGYTPRIRKLSPIRPLVYRRGLLLSFSFCSLSFRFT